MSLPNRKSLRLKNFNYASGYFFITLCAFDRSEIFGKIFEDEVVLSQAGQIVQDEWLRTGELRKDVDLDEFVIMPNHLHMVLSIGAGQSDLAKIMANFKSVCSKRIMLITQTTLVWQRSYYDSIIRSPDGLNRIRQYIKNNPAKWKRDREKFENDHWGG